MSEMPEDVITATKRLSIHQSLSNRDSIIASKLEQEIKRRDIVIEERLIRHFEARRKLLGLK